MMEHIFGLYMKVWHDQNKLWELRGNSVFFNENISMKKSSGHKWYAGCEFVTDLAKYRDRQKSPSEELN